MPILGVGVDIIESERIRELCERSPAFVDRVFTQVEQDYAMNKPSKYLHLAGRFAAKEAVAKALGTSFSWKEVEIVNESNGKPTVNLYGRAKKAAKGAIVHISISHTERYATAFAILEEP